MNKLDKITPLDTNVIVKKIEQESKSPGGIVLMDSAKEDSTEAIVLIPNVLSYHRDGTQRDPVLKKGDRVRLQRGNIGTGMPEAPEGEEWLAVPEDCIYYKVED